MIALVLYTDRQHAICRKFERLTMNVLGFHIDVLKSLNGLIDFRYGQADLLTANLFTKGFEIGVD